MIGWNTRITPTCTFKDNMGGSFGVGGGSSQSMNVIPNLELFTVPSTYTPNPGDGEVLGYYGRWSDH